MEKKEAFKQWGTINGFSTEKEIEFKIARAMHEQDELDNPEDHKWSDIPSRWRCWSDSRCKCGFGYSVDSSD